jgi:hypothetical protein
MLAGAAPVSAIPVFVLGWVSLVHEALFWVVPMALVAAALMVRGSAEGRWALRGFVAGLLAVFAYDAVRMPLVWSGIWPDFIPRLGGWIVGSGGTDTAVGYTWRWIGDGGGIGLSYFVFCALALSIRPAFVTARPVLLSIGYGIFIWSGLMATVGLTGQGEKLLFALTPASLALSLLGHLVYGAVLGLCLRRHLRAR